MGLGLLARKLPHRHELDCCHSKISKITEPRKDRVESPFGSEGSHVNFIED